MSNSITTTSTNNPGVTISPPFKEISFTKEKSVNEELIVTNNTGDTVTISFLFRKLAFKGSELVMEEIQDPSKNGLTFSNPVSQIKNGEKFTLKFEIKTDSLQDDAYSFYGIVANLKGSGQNPLTQQMTSVFALRGSKLTDKVELVTDPGTPLLPIVFVLPEKQTFSLKNIGQTFYLYSGEAKVVRGGLNTIGKTLDKAVFNDDGVYLKPGQEEKVSLSWGDFSKLDLQNQIGYYSVRSYSQFGQKNTTASLNYEFLYIPWWIALIVVFLLASLIGAIFWMRRNSKKQQFS